MISRVLYRRSFEGPYLKCVAPRKAQIILSEHHEGDCGNHSVYRSLANKALTSDFYCPTMCDDAKQFVKNAILAKGLHIPSTSTPNRYSHLSFLGYS